jgi:hypothetical protein
MKTGVELITEERQRQIEKEGWNTRHDDIKHDNGGLALAGVCYAVDVIYHIGEKYIIYPPLKTAIREIMFTGWPWDNKYWKPTPNDPVRQLTKGGALIAAEIDRLQRQGKF